MKRLVLAVAAVMLFSGFTLQWDPVNKYTDGTAIEPTKTVLYSVERGGAVVANKQPGTAYEFTTGKGVTESFRVQTELSTGEKSEWTAAYGWTSPLGIPSNPLNLRVAQ